MQIIIEKQTTNKEKSLNEKIKLYVVWIDTNIGFSPPDWEMNSSPKELEKALTESDEAKQSGFPTTITLEGITPRSDGLFSNPRTDP